MSLWMLVVFWVVVVAWLTVMLNKKPEKLADYSPHSSSTSTVVTPADSVTSQVFPASSATSAASSRYDHGSYPIPGAMASVGGLEQDVRYGHPAANVVEHGYDRSVRNTSTRRKSRERVLLEVHVQRVQEADQPERLRLSSVMVSGQEVLPVHLRPGDVFEEKTPALVGSGSANRRVSTSRRTASAEAGPRADGVSTRGLVVQTEPLEKILSGRKTLELRSKHNRQLGPVALIRKGSGLIYGVADIVESVGPMNLDEMYSRASEHGVEPYRIQEVMDQGWCIGWRLAKVQRLAVPVPYVHKGMSQVRLDDEAIEKLAHALRTTIRV